MKYTKYRRKVVLTAAIMAVWAVMAAGVSAEQKTEPESELFVETETETETENPSTEEFDEGRLMLIGALEYEGPDFEAEEPEDGTYTALMIQNVSDQFLRSAHIQVKVNDKEEMDIQIDSLPAGETVITTGKKYEGFQEGSYYIVEACESVYEENVSSRKDGIEVTFNSGKITVENGTGEEVSSMTVRYKARTGDLLFGGNTYEIPIDSLPAGQTCEAECANFLADSIEVVEIKE